MQTVTDHDVPQMINHDSFMHVLSKVVAFRKKYDVRYQKNAFRDSMTVLEDHTWSSIWIPINKISSSWLFPNTGNKHVLLDSNFIDDSFYYYNK